MNLANIQAVMAQEQIDCWVVYDFQGTNPIMAQLLQAEPFLTRRLFLIIPASGAPVLLGSKIDNDAIQSLEINPLFYTRWPEMESQLKKLLAPYQVIGMDYSPKGALPTVSRVDAGTMEMIRAMGKEVVSAANLFQAAAAVWGEGVLEAHLADCQLVAGIKDDAFELIGERLRAGQPITEYEVQQFIMDRFAEANLITVHRPIVAVNSHSSDPHYIPSQKKNAPITEGDWVLIDLWAKRPGYRYVFADMTWVGVAAAAPTAQQQEVFEAVAAGRDEAISYLQANSGPEANLAGWQVDDVVRDKISQAGYGDYFFHRTGHSLGPGDQVHGQGVNIDNLETHDTRTLIPGVGFTIEPGVYLPEFGVRLEINVYMDESGPRLTTPVQEQIICLL